MSFRKDKDAVLDYAFDWSDWLAASETITDHTLTLTVAEDGITLDSDDEDDGVVTVWLSGGTAGERYEVACRIETSQGRTDERTIHIDVRDR